MNTKRDRRYIAKMGRTLRRRGLNCGWAAGIFRKQFDLGSGNGCRLGIDNFDAEIRCRSRNGEKNYCKPAGRHTLLLYSRKGLVVEVRAGLLARE